jgi:hypothetical protein
VSVASARFDVLDHRFVVTWNFARAGADIDAVLGPFRIDVPTSHAGLATYALVDHRADATMRFDLTYEGAVLWAGMHPADVLDHLFWHVNAEAFGRETARLLIHAGAVTTPAGSAVLLPATSGSGKSTLVTGLVHRAGFGLLSDEAAVVDPSTLLVSPYPKAVTLKGGLEGIIPELAELRDTVADRGRRQWHLRADDIRPGSLADQPAPVSLVVFHRYAAGASTEVEQLTRAQTTVDLAKNTMNLKTFGRSGLATLAALTESAPGHRVTSSSLDDSIAVILDLAGGGKR